MITSLEINNFRGFKHLKINGLARFNVIIGPNASGKTALLEAMFLVSGSGPELSLRLRRWRGLGDRFEISQDRSSFHDLWRDLFHSDKDKLLSILLQDSEKGRRDCIIEYDPTSSVTLPLGEQSIDTAASTPLSFKWISGEKESTARVELTEKGIEMSRVPVIFLLIFLHANLVINPDELASRYSSLSKAGKEHEFLKTIQGIYPFVRGLSVEINAGLPTIFASVVGVANKIPVPLLAGGVNKYLSILLGIHAAQKGVVLVDEFENGFYYDTLTPIWSGIVQACLASDTQIFLTTHSMEALRALLPLPDRTLQDFCFLRTRRTQDRCEIERLNTEQVHAALIEGFEIR